MLYLLILRYPPVVNTFILLFPRAKIVQVPRDSVFLIQSLTTQHHHQPHHHQCDHGRWHQIGSLLQLDQANITSQGNDATHLRATGGGQLFFEDNYIDLESSFWSIKFMSIRFGHNKESLQSLNPWSLNFTELVRPMPDIWNFISQRSELYPTAEFPNLSSFVDWRGG